MLRDSEFADSDPRIRETKCFAPLYPLCYGARMENHFKEQGRHLLGFGLDGKDGHKRVTRGEHFHLLGGSEETHARMQEQTVKLTEQLKKRGQTIRTASTEEFHGLAEEVGLKVFSPESSKENLN